MPTSALEVVDGEVRELIRRRGLDPFTDPGPVRLLVRDVVADYSERSLTSALPPIGDPESVVRDVLGRVAGFGPLQRWLDDPEVEEVWVNEPGRVFVARRGRSELTTTILAPGELADLVERMLRTSGRRIDMSTPFVDAMMPDGSRLHVVIPDITRRHMAVNIRKFVLQAHSLDELVALGTLTPQAARFLEAAVVSGLNVLVAGGTQAGKTTNRQFTRTLFSLEGLCGSAAGLQAGAAGSWDTGLSTRLAVRRSKARSHAPVPILSEPCHEPPPRAQPGFRGSCLVCL
ncbi:ATPase, T2SS/T4P/T4SS family [Geodermatophilus sp. URMC 65]